jgi:hypothetical protein
MRTLSPKENKTIEKMDMRINNVRSRIQDSLRDMESSRYN